MQNGANQRKTLKLGSAVCSQNNNLGSHTNLDAPAILPTTTTTTAMCDRETKETKTKEERAPLRMWRGCAVSRYTSA